MSTDFSAWIGRSEVRHDILTPGHGDLIAATLDSSVGTAAGDPLPPLWHWAYFPPLTSLAELGSDGHPPLGGFLPPIPLTRRMWAGGRLAFQGRLHFGDRVERQTTILSVTEKHGKQGALIFVTLGHKFTNDRGASITEEQDIVYRAAETGAAAPSTPVPPVAAAPADWRLGLVPDSRLLFRFSAVTFNAHRIHYDRDYATNGEGYADLVVQGPLTATLLLDRLIRQTGRQATTFRFRGMAPLFSGQSVNLCGRATGAEGGYSLWAEGPRGQVAMTAEATTST